MAPTPEDFAALQPEVAEANKTRVVISGMSGLYPDSANVKEFSDILYNKVNPVGQKPRWNYSHPEVSSHVGCIPGVTRFDAQFFKVHFRLGNSMDSMCRKILEQSYQALFDAGLNPDSLAAKNVGVFIGTCFSESEKASFYLASLKTGFGILGCSKTMSANRISYWLNLKGPSMSIDEGCCSASTAIEQAYQAISRGDCDAAIVGSAAMCLHPHTTIHTGRVFPICPDGKTKSFDENSDGCARSEAIVIFILQKAEDALRVYGEIVHVKNVFDSSTILECVTGQEYGFNRDAMAYEKFLKSFYAEANISPDVVEYVEAFGSGVSASEKTELDTINNVFCQGRKDPLLVGSVMSNVGYTEASCGAVSLTKVLLGYYRGELAANMHLTTLRKDIQGFQEGKMQVVVDHQPFSRSYTAVNVLSLTGVSGHMLLHGRYKPKDLTKYECSIPRLVTISARHEQAARKILDELKSRPIDPEEIALLHNVHTTRIAGHLGKAYTVLGTDAEQKTVSLGEACEYFDGARRPLWFVYSGMGSQWAGMGTQLMRIPIFAAAIERCQKALEPKGINLVNIITSPEKTTFDNILNSFVGIAAVQIGLTDVLRELGLVPDMIIGHSVGELGCAYADGCFTAEEMILSAYSRGLVSVETPFIRGSMAAVGVGYQQIKDMVPPEIEVACHNAAESSTISGPAEIMKEFVGSLSAKGIFAKEVPCSNIAYHSRYIAEAGPELLKYLSEVIKDPKPRSERWVSTSVPMDKWDQQSAKFSSAEYHTNNLLNPVLFEETSKLIPANAVLVEIAPHGLLQAILKRSLPVSCKHIPLTRRGHPDNAFFVLDAIGKLYMEGYIPKLSVLYPKVEFPVSTTTPMLSHLVEWAHNEVWKVPLHQSAKNWSTASWKPIISVHDDENSYLRGHIIREKTVYPFAAALMTVWDTLAMTLGQPRKQISVQFSDIQLLVQPALYEQVGLRLSVALHRGTGRFEILNGSSKVATGYIQSAKKDEPVTTTPEVESSDTDVQLTSEDVYQMLYEREYHYSGDFRSIQRANVSLTEAYVEWSNNWVTLIDGLIQLNVLRQNHDAISQPRRIRSLKIEVENHGQAEKLEFNGKNVMKVSLDDLHRSTKCGGVSINNITFDNFAPSTSGNKVNLSKLEFVPHFNSNLDAKSAMQVFLQIVAQNVNKENIKVLEVKNYSNEETVFDAVRGLVDNISGVSVQFNQLTKDDVLKNPDFGSNVDLVLVQNLNMDDSIFEFLYNIVPRDAFVVISEETSLTNLRTRPSALYRVVSTQNDGELSLHLSHWRPNANAAPLTAFTVRSPEDFRLLATTRDSLPSEHKLLVITSYPAVDRVKELVASWRKESERNQVMLLMINYGTATDQDLESAPELSLAFNVLNNSIWGGEYYLPLVEKETKVSNMTLRCEQIGDLNSLRWVEVPQPDASDKGITVDVHYAGLNTLDAKRAAGIYIPKEGDDINFGMDFSGVTSNGTQVMGIVPNGSCSKKVRAHPNLLWPVPKHWTLEEAATVPFAYAHAFYCLSKGGLPKKNETILVHGGAGALGQAAITICLGMDIRVFTTVSDLRKKHFLMKMFPELREENIGCSRDHSFEDMIKSQTKGQGVDRSINCLPGDLKNVSLNCVRQSGLAIDAVQIPSNEDFNFGMYQLNMERNYITVDFSSLFSPENQLDVIKIQLLVSEGIARGYVRPLSRVSYAPHEAARALRLLQASRHRGRVLLRLAGAQPPAHPSITCSEHQRQLVVSDDPILGLQLVDSLVSRGARNLHLQVPIVPAQTLRKQMLWKDVGAEVSITTKDLRDTKNVQELLKKDDADSVEGIYLVSSKASDSKFSLEVVRSLDKVARQSKTLRYFAVLSDDHTFGNETCYARAFDRLPATKLCLPTIKQMSSTSDNNAVSWQQALDSLSRVLISAQPVVFAYPKNASQQSLLEQIAAFAGIEIPEDVAETATLEELGVTQDKAQSIKVYLRDERGMWPSEDYILSLTVKDILEIEQAMGGEFKEAKGLEVFFTYVDHDELTATIDMVFLETLTSSNTEEFNVNEKYLCIVPGLEGNYERFKELSERLKLPTLVLQSGLDRPHESIRETAEYMAATLLKKAHIQNNFYLLGYESGVLVALEIASILEEKGFTGTVYCVGLTPEQFQATLEEELQDFTTEAALQDAVIRHMFTLLTGRPCDLEFSEDMTWQEKVEYCMRYLHVELSAQYVRAHFEEAYGKILQARKYKPQPKKLRSNIVFLKSSSTHPISSSDSLQQYSEQPIIEHELNVPLAHILKDMRCASIINRHLPADVLAAFETKDLLETFAIKGVMFGSPEEIGISVY